ncbi:cell division protein GpsB [Mobiluncus mulieris]|nr:DivIVA domain protein [Mobiluncus mulieris ATCC 35243]SPX76087.1 cell division protein GpsB [Mobiluncus mulieris]
MSYGIVRRLQSLIRRAAAPGQDEVTYMALLTTDDIVNKKFQPTKFREGYDQDEVDDFLDEVVNTLDAMTKERDGLKQQLEEAHRRITELETASVAPTPVTYVETEPQPEPQPEPQSEPAFVEPQPQPEPAPAAMPAMPQGENESTSAVSMLTMAQRLHDEYVQNGQQEREEIIAKARVEADRIISEAEQEHSRVLAQLEQERGMLERKIEELRTFESDYRSQIRSYLEGVLADLAASAPNA